MDLRCDGGERSDNKVWFFEEPMNNDILKVVQEETGTGFKPDVYVRVYYKKVQEYSCSGPSKVRTRYIIINVD